ncbi:unnamed protein product [Adineta steineri]|uniref:G-protein coupled receptors family 1 profile domain-containing protein n=1 Tax=Adineta steineri TaxID=433720 RepID=A0A819C8N7_9BILA|nr:unnamed protein product [Adineta steineri]CAF3816674.1 unnamed protein product [Adineta steineri]
MSTNIQPSSTAIFGLDTRLIRYGSIFLLIVGTFGNIVSYIIFSYGTLRKSSTFRYLALLSLMDLLVLYSGLLDLFLMTEYGGTFSLRNLNPVSCRLHTFITYWSQHSSSWILSFISVDRAVATNFIKFAKKFCTPRSAEYIVGIILLLTALLNCHELIFLRLQHDTNSIEYHQNQTIVTAHESLILNESDINNNLIQKRNTQSIFSICDNSQWNSTCLRNKRDLSDLNITTTTTIVPFKTKLTDKKCEALQGSRYEFFWDHVWEWIDVCLYALIPFTVMSIGTFLIVYRVYYQQRRVFRSRRSGANNPLGTTPNKAKSLFYLLFTLNLLYFILVSPVVFVTTILFRSRDEEGAYPRFKAIIYLMQYCNHSLNFIFYGITSPPYRRTLCEWFLVLFPHLPQCCQRTIRQRSKSVRLENINLTQTNKNLKKANRLNTMKQTNLTIMDNNTHRESVSLVPR